MDYYIQHPNLKINQYLVNLERSSPHFAALVKQRRKVCQALANGDGDRALQLAEAICPLAQAHDHWLERRRFDIEQARRRAERGLA
jgi:hypothetical protein